ncbi:3-deoxy-D-manno-octulosonic acid transferase [Methylobrevis pamukkalensis]|uniref:3-deoxy-D-manno-octulosonic acid transferase n=1 Tax=Methylobrevis pamukkalensis TaxID=1439726 RepID=A0A1E3H5N0_9HYPH|nr:3-deoxy-D-manno-octulosonic acid transferase [Methylobrevis pamukkalensis]ODN71622.1 3-deoxy-D-manno-octulosonic acid transferase [Methylobrevis pamukkalensis]
MKDSGEFLIRSYVGATRVARPLVRGLVHWRRIKGKEHEERWRERLGEASLPTPAAPVVWVHAASVGETVAVMPLIYRIAATGVGVVLTTVTLASATLVAGRLPRGVCHQFVPLDIAPYVDRFLATWDPQLAIFVESEIWPVTIARLDARNVPLVVCNARMSPRSFAGWRRWPALSHAVFSRIRHCLAQSDADADRFRQLGAPRVSTIGNIKFDAPVPEASRTVAEALSASIDGRPVFLAASTHPGEEDIVLDAFTRALSRNADLLLILAPRHPARGPDVAGLASGHGLRTALRSIGALPERGTQVYVADTVGELGTLYRLARVAFIGGSLNPRIGGHNPIEPGGLGTAVVAGPNVGNWSEIYEALKAESALTEVRDATELFDAVDRLVNLDNTRQRQAEAARRVVARFSGALARTQAAIDPLIDPLIVSARLARRMPGPA